MDSTPAMTPQQREFTDTQLSGLGLYRRLVVGDGSVVHFLSYEAAMLLLSNTPGLLGLGLRAVSYPRLFRGCGKRPAIGKGVLIRIPQQIELGSGVVIDDNASLDVRGADASIRIADRVSIGRLTTIAAKHGHIHLGKGCNIGSYCRIATNSQIDIGESVLVGAYCYVGPGNHTAGEAEGDGGSREESLISRPMEIKGGVTIGEHAWLGARVTVMDGVRIGKHAIIGAHSLVREDVPDYGVAVGAPARVIRIREGGA
jgi:acetyltransferase-like isoleucine patch superfamily enzyme